MQKKSEVNTKKSSTKNDGFFEDSFFNFKVDSKVSPDEFAEIFNKIEKQVGKGVNQPLVIDGVIEGEADCGFGNITFSKFK